MQPQFLLPNGLLSKKPYIGAVHIHTLPIPGTSPQLDNQRRPKSEVSAMQACVRVCTIQQAYVVTSYDLRDGGLKERLAKIVPFARVHRIDIESNDKLGARYEAPIAHELDHLN